MPGDPTPPQILHFSRQREGGQGAEGGGEDAPAYLKSLGLSPRGCPGLGLPPRPRPSSPPAWAGATSGCGAVGRGGVAGGAHRWLRDRQSRVRARPGSDGRDHPSERGKMRDAGAAANGCAGRRGDAMATANRGLGRCPAATAGCRVCLLALGWGDPPLGNGERKVQDPVSPGRF